MDAMNRCNNEVCILFATNKVYWSNFRNIAAPLHYFKFCHLPVTEQQHIGNNCAIHNSLEWLYWMRGGVLLRLHCLLHGWGNFTWARYSLSEAPSLSLCFILTRWRARKYKWVHLARARSTSSLHHARTHLVLIIVPGERICCSRPSGRATLQAQHFVWSKCSRTRSISSERKCELWREWIASILHIVWTEGKLEKSFLLAERDSRSCERTEQFFQLKTCSSVCLCFKKQHTNL